MEYKNIRKYDIKDDYNNFLEIKFKDMDIFNLINNLKQLFYGSLVSYKIIIKKFRKIKLER